MTTTMAHAPETAGPASIAQDTWSASLAAIEKAQFLSLTTFRRSGVPVSTPVWFARVGQALYVITDEGTGKVKRIRHQAAVRVAPCSAMGKPTGVAVDAIAHAMPVADASHGLAALTAKYGWIFSLFQFFHRVRGSTPVMLEIAKAD